MTQSNLCPHGQEFYCRICGTITHPDKPEETLDAAMPIKKDYSGDRGSVFYYYGQLKTPLDKGRE